MLDWSCSTRALFRHLSCHIDSKTPRCLGSIAGSQTNIHSFTLVILMCAAGSEDGWSHQCEKSVVRRLIRSVRIWVLFQPDDWQDGLAASHVCPIDGVIVMQHGHREFESRQVGRPSASALVVISPKRAYKGVDVNYSGPRCPTSMPSRLNLPTHQ